MPAIHGWTFMAAGAAHTHGLVAMAVAACLVAIAFHRQEARRLRWAARIDRFRLSLYGDVELLELFDRMENRQPDPGMELACCQRRARLDRLLGLFDGLARDLARSGPRRDELDVLAEEFLIAFESSSVQAYLALLDGGGPDTHERKRPYGAFRDLAEQFKGQPPR